MHHGARLTWLEAVTSRLWGRTWLWLRRASRALDPPLRLQYSRLALGDVAGDCVSTLHLSSCAGTTSVCCGA